MIDFLNFSALIDEQDQQFATAAHLRAGAATGMHSLQVNGLSTVSLSTPSFRAVLEKAVQRIDSLQHIIPEARRPPDMEQSDDPIGVMPESGKAEVRFRS